jgi:hypothetical protein
MTAGAEPDLRAIRVSVIIPAYNAARSLPRTIDSVLAQTFPPAEIIVVDDGSADDTAAVAEAYGDRVRVIRKANGGPASARNLGAREASGEWLALLDADDQWLSNKLERQLPYTRPPEVGLVHSLICQQPMNVPLRLTFEDLWDRNWICNSTVLVRRDAFMALGGFDETRELISVEDYNLWTRLAASRWQIVLCPEQLTRYARGIGISSNAERFLKASLCNLTLLGQALGLPARQVRAKMAATYHGFGRAAVFERDLPRARHLLRQALRCRPGLESAVLLGIACLPVGLLNSQRTLRQVINRYRAQDLPDEGPEFAQLLDEMLQDILPGPGQDHARSLFRALALLAVRNGHAAADDQGAIPRMVQDLAWLGYSEPGRLLKQLGAGLPRDEAGRAAAQLLGEPAATGRTHLFLPVLAASLRRGAALPGTMGIDALLPHPPLRSLLPNLLPQPAEAGERARATYHLALLILEGRGLLPGGSRHAAAAAVAELLRRLFQDAPRALKELRLDQGDAAAPQIAALTQEVEHVGRHLWLDALFLAEQILRDAAAGAASATRPMVAAGG